MASVVLAACTSTGSGDETTTTTTVAAETTTTPPGTTTSTVGEVPELMAADCPFEIPGDFEADCFWLEVPADRDDPTGEMIRLQVAVFPSDSPDPAPDPVVYLEGGPGGEALEALPFTFERVFAHLLADRDVVIFDQRGTGFSEPALACPEVRELGFELIDDVLTPEEYIPLTLDSLQECRDRLAEEGVLLDEFTSAYSAADLADLRLALGVDEWNIYGISYGTRLALTTMRDHPEGIRSVVLDSVYAPDDNLLTESPANLVRALDELFDGCASNPSCAAAYPDLEATFYETIEALDANPVRAPVTDGLSGQTYEDAVFDGSAFGGIVFQALYSAEVIPVLPRIITGVAEGDLYELSVLASTFITNGEFVSLGMQFSVQCNEEAVFSSRDDVAAAVAEYPDLEGVFVSAVNLGPSLFDACEFWEAGSADAIENEEVSSDIPTLVMTGEYDPITPPSWGIGAAENLTSATVVGFPGAGHGPSATLECPQEILRSFLDDPTVQIDDSCAAEMGPPDFVTPDTPPPEVNLVPFSEQFAGVTVSGLVPDSWEEQGPGVWARMLNGLDQTALVQQFAAGANTALLLGAFGDQFGLDPGAQPASTYASPAGDWAIYDAVAAGTPGFVAFAEVSGGTAIVILFAPPAELGRLEQQVLIPVLDAIEPST